MIRVVFVSAVMSLTVLLAACNESPTSTTPAASQPSASQPSSSVAPYRIYSENDQVELFTAATVLQGKTFDDGQLWVRFKGTGETHLAADHTRFGEHPYVQGAVASQDGRYAYTLVSTPTQTGQVDVLYRVNLQTRDVARLGSLDQLELSGLNARTLTISDDGTMLAFRGTEATPLQGAVTRTGREETYDTPAVYTLRLPPTAALSATIERQNLRLVQRDQGEGLLPQFEQGQLRVVATPGTSSAEDSKLSAQAYAYNLRFPLANYAYHVTTTYGQLDHVRVYNNITLNDEYAVDFNRAGTADCGLPVVAATDGRVTESFDSTSGYGNRIWITHDNLNAKTLYAHLQSRNVAVGATVTRGQTIGFVGTTGNSSGCHLHFAYHNATTDAGIKPATTTKPMEGVGPASSEAGVDSLACPITAFESANTNTWYRGRNC